MWVTKVPDILTFFVDILCREKVPLRNGLIASAAELPPQVWGPHPTRHPLQHVQQFPAYLPYSHQIMHPFGHPPIIQQPAVFPFPHYQAMGGMVAVGGGTEGSPTNSGNSSPSQSPCLPTAAYHRQKAIHLQANDTDSSSDNSERGNVPD